MKAFLFIILFACITMLVTGCATGYEGVQPFRNLSYAGDRLFPIKNNDSRYSLRIWINNSTSLSRVISIYKDTLTDYSATLTEFGTLVDGKSSKEYLKTTSIVPKSGFEKFKKLIESMNLFEVKDKPGIELAFHQPFSTYVVEIKEYGKFNSFKFDTYYPNPETKHDEYSAIEKMIFEEFEIRKRFRFEPGNSESEK